MNLKFRVWHKPSKKYLELFTLHYNETGIFAATLFDDKKEVRSFANEMDIEVQVEDIKDKNGKDIYEGDVVKTNEADWIAVVVFEYGMFLCRDRLGGFSSSCDWSEFEVLGNVHENLDLLST
jgi:uncharacterized phage protein (TIGR01671 family)